MRRHLVLIPILVVLSACGSVSSQPVDGGPGAGGSGVGGAGTGGSGPGGSSAGGSGGSAQPPTVDQACTTMAQALCTRLGECAPVGVPLFYGDMATCVERAKLGCSKEQEVPDISRTAANIVACADAASVTSCDDLLANIFPAACHIKPGVRIDGEGCGSSMQCASTHCEKPMSDCGVCAARSPVNGTCSSDDGCAVGLVCAANKCVMPGGTGAICDAARPCRGNLYCSSAGTCAARAPVGTACGGDANICDIFHGAGCNPFAPQASRTCEMISVAKGGQACGIINSALTLCVQGNQCAGATLLQPGVCASPAADGQACDNNVHCLPPANCVNGLCRLPSVGSCTK
jgi:hypothetical protein